MTTVESGTEYKMMPFTRFIFACFIVFITMFTTGCEKKISSAEKNDEDLISQFMTLPIEPEEARLEVMSLGSNDTQLFAVLSYTTKNFQTLLQQLESQTTATPLATLALATPDWFDQQQLPTADVKNGKYIISSSQLKSAKMFYRSPYLSGASILLKNENTLLVSLYTQ